MLDQSTAKDRDDDPPEQEKPLEGTQKGGDEHLLPEPFLDEEIASDDDDDE